MRKLVVVLLAVGCLAVLAGTLAMPIPGQVDLQAQKGCDPKTQKCATGCSPGFYKNHPVIWVGICCDGQGQPSCADLTTALNCKGSDANCGRSAAAAVLDACTGCSE